MVGRKERPRGNGCGCSGLDAGRKRPGQWDVRYSAGRQDWPSRTADGGPIQGPDCGHNVSVAKDQSAIQSESQGVCFHNGTETLGGRGSNLLALGQTATVEEQRWHPPN